MIVAIIDTRAEILEVPVEDIVNIKNGIIRLKNLKEYNFTNIVFTK